MGRKKDLTSAQKQEIFSLKQLGFSLSKIADIIGCHHSTVSKLCSTYEDANQLTYKRSNCGSKSKLTSRGQRQLRRIVVKNRKASLDEITSKLAQSIPVPICKRTVQSELHNLGYYGRSSCSKPNISKKNLIKRKKWCFEKKSWEEAQWQTVIWSDETTIRLFSLDNRTTVWRKSQENFHPDCTSKIKQGGPSVMAWGCFCNGKRGPLVFVNKSLNHVKYIKILNEQLLPFARQLFPDGKVLFQQDNATSHVAKDVQEWFKTHSNELVLLQWPPQSPDISPIENIWHILKKKISQRNPRPQSLDDLRRYMKEEWERIPEIYFKNCALSINKRIKLVLTNKGYPIKY